MKKFSFFSPCSINDNQDLQSGEDKMKVLGCFIASLVQAPCPVYAKICDQFLSGIKISEDHI